jgi:hypothetical protein
MLCLLNGVQLFIELRSNLKSHGAADAAKSVAYGKRVKVYPLSQAANPPPTAPARWSKPAGWPSPTWPSPPRRQSSPRRRSA